MSREKFLQQVADYYVSSGIDLSNYTFVFPNRRSAMFAKRYMQQSVDVVSFMPKMISVTSFTQQFNGTALATPTELVFILYNVYCDILRKHGRESQIPEFDSFYFWGTILINDFNDIDAYMVDPAMIFRNLKSVKEISANYLTDEQIEIIELLWGKHTAYRNPEIFWNHMPTVSDTDTPSDHFINLWEIMGELYENFIKRLDSLPTPLSYSGLQSRRACETIKNMSLEQFAGQRFAFVGFNVLSAARTLIFKRLQDLGIAEFFWDTASPFLRNRDGKPSKAGRFIIPLSERFPSPDDFDLDLPTTTPDIKIISMPSAVGQAKVAADVLQNMLSNKLDEPANMIETTVVLADESLLVPMMYAVPEDISPVNVTMGVNYSTTPFSSLMSSIISMHLRSYSVRGEMHYFYMDVLNVITHQYIENLWPQESASLNDLILSDHLYNVKAEEIMDKYPALAFIFKVVEDPRNIAEVSGYIHNVLDILTEAVKSRACSENEKDYYELAILQGYRDAVDDLCRLMQTHGVGLQERTFFQIIERTMSMMKMHVAGMPLKGLQIMGVMDTRALDFKNVIILSVNERIFPKRNYTASLIPANLRRGYMLPTSDHEESSYAYQFYRLLTRAERVTLVYDSRMGGANSGEISRYAAQLMHLQHGYKVSKINYEMQSQVSSAREIVIEKTDTVMSELREYFPGGKLRLSASALKTYISCPLRFYLQYVKGVRDSSVVMEYIDAASYGSILHRILQDLYMPYKGKRINEETINAMMHSDLERLAIETLDREYYKSRYAGRYDRMPGEGLVTARIIARYVKNMLRIEKDYKPFIFHGAEVGERNIYEWKINDRYTVNFKMSVDRIDITEPSEDRDKMSIRFIDYKTGGDVSESTGLAKLFTEHKYGGMFQLLLYCHAYAAIFGFKGRIKPVIYGFVKMATDGIPDMKLGARSDKVTIYDYRDADAITDDEGRNFYQRFEDMIDMIFGTEHPFCQTEKLENCRYCPFAQICGRPQDV